MLKLTVGSNEFTPNGLGATEVAPNGVDKVVVLEFNSELDVKTLVSKLKSLSDDDTITLSNEKNSQVYTGYTSMNDKITIVPKEDGTFDYTVTMEKKNALDISLENTSDIKSLQASVDYLTVLVDADSVDEVVS